MMIDYDDVRQIKAIQDEKQLMDKEKLMRAEK